MGIVNCNAFGFKGLKEKIEKSYQSSDSKILRRLTDLGLEMCNHARTITPNRESGGYNDQTGNLRSSIGFRIYYNGEAVKDGGFADTGGGSKGRKAAKTALDEYAATHAIDVNGWTLVIVAGMSYATYVEAKGYNVLHLTDVELKKQITKLKKQLKK